MQKGIQWTIFLIVITNYSAFPQMPNIRGATPEIIDSLYNLISSSKDDGFKFFLLYTSDIDTIMHNNLYAESKLHEIIEREEINQKIYQNGQPFELMAEPDWDLLQKCISNKYSNKWAEFVVLSAKMKYLQNKKEWRQFYQLYVARVTKYGFNGGNIAFIVPEIELCKLPESWKLNACAWDVFNYCSDTSILKKALAWSVKSIRLTEKKPDASFLDTHANLLYKLGKRKQAITEEEKAIKINPKLRALKSTLEKMKNEEITWVAVNNDEGK